ncbi:hypothetical protein [Methyloceanibacter stevinii]|uniref:hypothetical protein n=1 Tax=Methyloceanibacter stevinii TaxID=1774970 RepID=UPI0019D3B6F3|nr:hypothetical protein [Methyloceanibacter stevinii]
MTNRRRRGSAAEGRQLERETPSPGRNALLIRTERLQQRILETIEVLDLREVTEPVEFDQLSVRDA